MLNSIFDGDFYDLEGEEREKEYFLLAWVKRPFLRRVCGMDVSRTRIGAA